MVQRPVSDRLQRQAEEQRVLKERLLEEHGLTGHPKGDKLFELAWEHGHSAGIHEVELYFGEFAKLLKSDTPGEQYRLRKNMKALARICRDARPNDGVSGLWVADTIAIALSKDQ